MQARLHGFVHLENHAISENEIINEAQWQHCYFWLMLLPLSLPFAVGSEVGPDVVFVCTGIIWAGIFGAVFPRQKHGSFCEKKRIRYSEVDSSLPVLPREEIQQKKHLQIQERP